MDQLSVFIIWSGDRSHAVAKAIKTWLPDVVRNANAWLSSEDLGKGLQWLPELNKNLSGSGFGLVVVTAESKAAPWLLFESGIVSKALPDTHCCPILCDLKPTDVSGPLASFQSTTVTKKEDMLLLVKTMNEASGTGRVDDERLTKWFNMSWSEFERQVIQILAAKPSAATRAGPNQMELLEEILATVRRTAIEPRSRFEEMMMGAGPLVVPPEILIREFSTLPPPAQERLFGFLRQFRHSPEAFDEMLAWVIHKGLREHRVVTSRDERPSDRI